MVEEVSILLDDLEDVRTTIAACINFFTAQDVARAQQQLSRMRKSALTVELEQVKERLDGILGDYFLNKHDEERAEAESELEEEFEPDEHPEELDPNPLGSTLPKKQQGTRIVPKYLQDEPEDQEVDEDE